MTTVLGILYQCLTTLSIKSIFLIPNLFLLRKLHVLMLSADRRYQHLSPRSSHEEAVDSHEASLNLIFSRRTKPMDLSHMSHSLDSCTPPLDTDD